MSNSPISDRWAELTSMLNTEEGRARIHMLYMQIAASLSASAAVVLSVTPVRMIEAILDHEFPPQIGKDSK